MVYYSMTVKKDTYTLWQGSAASARLLDTRPHLTEHYMDLLEKAFDLQQESNQTITIYSSREADGPVYSSLVDPAPIQEKTPAAASPTPDPAYDGWEGSWAGDGSGMDDLADYNAMEGRDY